MPTRAVSATRLLRVTSRRRGIWRLALLGVILLTVAGYVSPVRDYIEKSGKISEERAATEALRKQHEELLLEKENLLRNEYVERAARRDLGMVKPGEQPFVVRNLEQEAPPAPAAPDSENKSLMDRFLETVNALLP